MSKFDEKNIIAKLQNAQTRRKAFEDVVNHYGSTLYWQIRHIVQNHDDADDILQNTFLKAWKNLDQFRFDSKISTWLYRIAYNESLTFIKQQHPTMQLESEMDETANYSEIIAVDPDIDGELTNKLFMEAIDNLPNKQKAVFSMKYFDEMKYEEISDITGTSIGALKASYHIAVQKITTYLKLHN